MEISFYKEGIMQKGPAVFLTIYALLYGAMHFYFFLSMRHLFPSRSATSFLFLPFSLIMILGPVLLSGAGGGEWKVFAFYLARLFYFWMGFLFLSVFFLMIMDLSRFISYFAARNPLPSVRTGFLISLCLSLSVCFYGYSEAGRIRVTELVFETPMMDVSAPSFRIVQISDVHLGILGKRSRLEKMAELIKRMKPDLVVSTGDLVDGQNDLMDGFSGILRNIDPPRGKYAIMGNHEFYRGEIYSETFSEQSGFTILRNRVEQVTPFLWLAGVDDPSGRMFGHDDVLPEDDILRDISGDRVMILLKHRPEVDPDSLGLFDLQLSGHTHGGQIFPFTIFTSLAYPYGVGLRYLERGSFLYVSSGAGTWGPPFRFLAHPEISVIDIKGSIDESRSIRYRRQHR